MAWALLEPFVILISVYFKNYIFINETLSIMLSVKSNLNKYARKT